MNTKTIIIGAAATALAFGIGFGIPMISHAGFEITSYDQAKELVENASQKSIEAAKAKAAKDEVKADKTATDVESISDNGENVQDKGIVSKEDAGSVKSDKTIVDRGIDIDDKTVVLDWDYLDWEVADVKMGDSDFFKVANNLGINPNTVEYSDSGFKINNEGQEWNGKKANAFYRYRDESNSYVNVYYDGERYVTDTLDDVPDEVNVIPSISIRAAVSDPNNSEDYWNISYEFGNESGQKICNQFYFAHRAGGITSSDRDDISKITKLPFTGGTFEELDSIMKISEMVEKGMKDESQSKDDYEKYIVKTNLGKCVMSISQYESTYSYFEDGSRNEKTAKYTSYYLSFGDKDYDFCAGFEDGNDQATYVNYYYFPKAE
ncbi:MAG: hypothetical protein K6E68_02075 [Lachnospiraceae bacterium]|nr:hypothetical protein [Lachnospiraceae bacterium]